MLISYQHVYLVFYKHLKVETNNMVDQKLIENLVTIAKKQDGVEKFVVGAVITKNERILLLRRVPNDFMGGLVELPSGTVDAGEDLIMALKRETMEETGLIVEKVIKFLNSFDYVSSSGKKTRQFNFMVDVATGNEVKLSPLEHDAYYYVQFNDEAFKILNISENVKEVISMCKRN